MEKENFVAEAIFDFSPTDSIELALKKGDFITVRRSAGNGWLEGERDGKVGLFPSSYIKVVEPSSPSEGPVSAKKPLIDHMLALEQKSTFVPGKAAELFVDGQKGAIVAGPQWKDIKDPIIVIVRDPQIETRFNGMKQYTVYVVETEAIGAVVSRRYKHFLWLYDRLAELFPCLSLPPIPVKQFSGNLDPEFVYHRRRGLERFLNRCACHPVFAYSKVFRDFLVLKDEKEWKIGSRHKPKKLFSPTIYSAVEYPQHNVPHSELVYVEKFSQFMRLLEANMSPVQQACQKQGDGYGSIALSMTELGCNLQKLAKGTQMENRSSTTQRRASAQVTGMNAVQKQIQRSAAELEESNEHTNYNWGWKDSSDFSTLMSDLQELGCEICKIAELFNFQQGILDQTLTDLITDYNGITLTIPGLVKLHQDAMEIYESSKEKDSKKNAEAMKMNCETLHNIVLAEFDYLHRNLVADFRYIIALYLRKQADFHLQLAERYELLHQSFMHLDTKFGCQPPMSSNGVDVSVEESDNDDDTLVDSPASPKKGKKSYMNFFPKSCYENVQFKQSKGMSPARSVASNAGNTIEVDVFGTLSPPPTSAPNADQPLSTTTPSAVYTTHNTSTLLASPVSVSVSSSDTATGTTTSAARPPMTTTPDASVEVVTTSASQAPTMITPDASAVVVTMVADTSSGSHKPTAATSSKTSLDGNDGPVSTTRHSSADSKVKSAVIEVGGINPVYQPWSFKQRDDSTVSKQITTVTPSKEVPIARTKPSGYDVMEPILKPSTYSSSVFFSAPSSVIDSQVSEMPQPSAPSNTVYENVVAIGNGKFTVTPSSSCDSKESLNFPLDSSPKEQASLNRSNSTGSMLPHPTVRHHDTFCSPTSNRKDVIKHSASLSNTSQNMSDHRSSEISHSACFSVTATSDHSKVSVRGSTAISKGTVKKKIHMFESSTLPSGSKSLAELGIMEDNDGDNSFVV